MNSFMGSISMINQYPKDNFPVDFPESYGGKEDSGDNSKTSVLKYRSGCYKRRKMSHTSTKIIPNLTDDGQAWRKYGQKVILNAKHPRSYYRCTHKFDQGCQATKQVQKTEGEPPMYRITYHGIHTCQSKPLETPQLILETTHFNDSQFLLSFNPSNISHSDPTFQSFSLTHNIKSPFSDCHVSPDLSAIESSAPVSVFSPGSDQGDVISYFSATSAPNNGFNHLDLMESFHGFSENLELEFEHCCT